VSRYAQRYTRAAWSWTSCSRVGTLVVTRSACGINLRGRPEVVDGCPRLGCGGRARRAETREIAISRELSPQSWTYSEEYVPEDDALRAARGRAEEVGVSPIGAGGGAALRFLAALVDAKAVVEIGTGTGVSGLWLLRGMQPDGVLTSVDLEAEHQRLAKETFSDAGIPPQRYRLITGPALEVLPRLTDGHYDLVLCDAAKGEYGEYLREALRLLRPGGVVAMDNALWHGAVADASQRDEETVSLRELGQQVREDESLLPVLLPVGDGLLVARKLP